jgi:hypothetical protein
MPITANILSEFGAKLLLQQGQIDVLFGFVTSKLDMQDFEKYIRFVVESDKFSEGAKIFAHEWIRHNSLWPSDVKPL